MAIVAHTPGAPTRAPSNVTRLPTAPKRKVQQHYNRAARAARSELPSHPAEFILPGQRRALRRAQRIDTIARTPALMIACALYRAMDPETRTKVIVSLAPGFAAESGPARDAVEMLLAATMTVGEEVDLAWARSRLAREGC